MAGSVTRMKTLKRFFRDQSGATALEYALMVAGISIVIVAAVNGLGSVVNDKYETTLKAMQ